MIRKIRGACTKTSVESERIAGNAQTLFGHAGAETDALGSLRSMYQQGSSRELRARMLANDFLSGAPMDILEIGAGFGDLSVYFSTLYPQHRYVINDLAEAKFERYFDIVKEYFKVTREFQCIPFAVESIPFPNDSFDRIFIRAAVHHFDEPDRAFSEMRRVLRSGGKLVFFQDPIALDIPIVSRIQKFFAGSEEKAMGFNEHVYQVAEYMSFGCSFSDRQCKTDPFFLREIDKQSKNWSGVKRRVLAVIRSHPYLFRQFLIRQYGIPFYFVFTK